MRNIAGIIGVCVPVLGIIIYYVCYETGIIEIASNIAIVRSIWFYSVCAGLSGILYFASNLKTKLGLVMFVTSFYWIYLLLVYSIFFIFEPDANYKWIFVSCGGIIICLILGLLFRQNSP
jgi:hypothetical protein